jgi:hypothetical protein
MTNADVQIEMESVGHLIGGFDPYGFLIHFGWSVSIFGLYMYLNVGVVAFLWLVRHCQPRTRERCLRWAIRSECSIFVAAVVWASIVLLRLHNSAHDLAAREIDRAFALAAFVQARDGIITWALLSGVIGLCVTLLLWRSARKALFGETRKDKMNCEPQGGGYSPSAARPAKPTP